MGSLFFNREELNSYFEKLVLERQDDISEKELASFYSVGKDDVQYLIQEGHLYTNHWQSPNDLSDIDVKYNSFMAFHQKYICLNREAKKTNRRITSFKNALDIKGVDIDININRSFFVKRSNRCIEAINESDLSK